MYLRSSKNNKLLLSDQGALSRACLRNHRANLPWRQNMGVSANREMRRSAMLSDFERPLCGMDLR